MPKRSLLPESVEQFAAKTIAPETPVQQRLRQETSLLEQAGMQIGADQGRLLGLLVHLLGAKNCLEVGTFTGYSALAVAMALPPDGKLICCDVSDEWTSIGRKHWADAGVQGKIDLRLAPASETLQSLLDEGMGGTFDFAFIDADKANYDNYYELCLRLLRPGGMIALDNMLWDGKVADPDVHDEDTDALRALNLKVRDDDRAECVLLTVGDGIMLARKL